MYTTMYTRTYITMSPAPGENTLLHLHIHIPITLNNWTTFPAMDLNHSSSGETAGYEKKKKKRCGIEGKHLPVVCTVKRTRKSYGYREPLKISVHNRLMRIISLFDDFILACSLMRACCWLQMLPGIIPLVCKWGGFFGAIFSPSVCVCVCVGRGTDR